MSTPNRIVLPAMDMNVSVDGEIEQREIDHRRPRRRRGGVDHPGGTLCVSVVRRR